MDENVESDLVINEENSDQLLEVDLLITFVLGCHFILEFWCRCGKSRYSYDYAFRGSKVSFLLFCIIILNNHVMIFGQDVVYSSFDTQ